MSENGDPSKDQEALAKELKRIKRSIDLGEFENADKSLGVLDSSYPNHPEIVALRNRLAAKKKLMAPEVENLQISTLTCPNCKASLELKSKDSVSCVCSSCSRILEFSAEGVKLSPEKLKKSATPRSFIQLGQRAKLQGKEFEVIGFLRYSSQTREWDDEDNQYCTGSWNHDEWLLVGENKEYLFICEDDEGYSIDVEFTPKTPKIPSPQDAMLSLTGVAPLHRIKEFSTSTLQHIQGEFTWIPPLNERVQAAEYQDGPITYSVEWRIDSDTNQPKEIEFFRSTKITKRDLSIALGRQDIAKEEDQKRVAEKIFNRWSNAFLLVAFVLALVCMFSLFKSGKQIAAFSKTFAEIDSEADDSGIIVGPFSLTEVGKIHKLTLETKIHDNSEAWGGVELLDDSHSAINLTEHDFWRESGRDSDGAWSESDTDHSMVFRLATPGLYFARLFAESNSNTDGEITVRVFSGVPLARYYLIGSIICFGFAGALRFFKSINPFYALIGVFAIGLMLLAWVGKHSEKGKGG